MRVFNRVSLLTVLLLALASAAHADGDMDEIIKQHLDSRGGYDRVSGLQRYEMSGTITRNGQTSPVHVWWKYPNKLRIDVGHGDDAVTSVFDGQAAWSLEPCPWGKEPTGMVPGWRELFIRQADFGGPFLNPEKRGLRVSRDTGVWGPTGYKFLVKREEGRTDEILLDPNTRLAKAETFRIGPSGFEHQVEQKYSKYRRTLGFAMPARIERYVDGELYEVLNIDQFTIGPEVSDQLFVIKGADYSGANAANLVDLNQLSDLRDRFVADAGHVRLVAVLSPTSPDSRREYLELQKTLNRINDDRVRAYVVWTNVLDTDQRPAACKRAGEFKDSRITYFWDQNRVAANGWEKVLDARGTTAWSSCFLHGPKASWESSPSTPDFWYQVNGSGAVAAAEDADSFSKISELLTAMPEDEKGGKGGKSR